MSSRGMSSSVQSSCSSKHSFCYAKALVLDDSTTVDDLCEAVTTLEDAERIARRVLGGAHPTTENIAITLRKARAALGARETPPPSGSA